MINLLSKAHQRKFKLVVLLSNSQNYIDVGTLAKKFNCTERTIQDDIKELSTSDISNIFEIEIRSKKYKLRMKNNMSIDAFGHYIMSDNDSFSLLEYVFFNNDLCIEELAEVNHISLPTLYRMINRINRGLKSHFRLKFQTNPCRLTGDEVEIRSFYIQYFVEKYPISEWPFDEINHDKFIDMFDEITKSLGFAGQFSFLRTLEILLAVSNTRFKQGFRVTGRGNPRLEALENKLGTSSALFNKFLDVFEGETDPRLFKDNLAYVVTDYFFFNYEELLNNAGRDEYSARSFIHLSEMFNELSKKYNISLVNKDVLIYSVHNSGQMGLKNINVRYMIIDNKAVLLQQFRSLFPDFYLDMELRIKTYIEIMELEPNNDLLNHLIHNVVTRWENLLQHLYSVQRKINIRVVSSHDIYHAKLMKTLLINEFSDQIEVSVLDSIEIDDILDKKSDIDIFVSNFTIPVHDKSVVAVNDIPTSEDFTVINELITEIRLHES